MDSEREEKLKRLNKLIDLANKTDKQIEKMNYKEKQKVYKAKSSLAKLKYDSSKGPYINWNKKKKEGN